MKEIEFTKEQISACRSVGRALNRADAAGLSLRIAGGSVALIRNDAPVDDCKGDLSELEEYCLNPMTRIDAHGGA